MKKIILLIFLLLLSNPVFAEWTEEKVATELCYLSSVINDWAQTRDISKHSDLFETNTFLGEHPKNSKIDLYFTALATLHAVGTYLLPEKYAKVWQLWGAWRHSAAVANNDANGLEQDIGVSYQIRYTLEF